MYFLAIFCLTLVAVHFPSSFAAKILVFSQTSSRSHMILNGRVADSLAKDGHNVTLMEVQFNVPLDVLNASKLARTLRVPGQFATRDNSDSAQDFEKAVAQMAFEEFNSGNIIARNKPLNAMWNRACEKFVLNESALLQRLKADKFDMIISEQWDFCGAGLAHLLAIPTYILLSSCPIQEHVASMLGLPNPSSYIPAIIGSYFTDRMSLAERLVNLDLQIAGYITFTRDGIDQSTQMFRRIFGEDFPDLRDIVKESPIVLVNVDEVVDFPRPIFSNIVYIGGLGMDTENEKQGLPEPIKSEMAKGANGVVLFSLGSIVRTTDMTEEFRQNIFRAFSQHSNYHFIVKIEKADNFSAKLANELDNVFISPWLPQAQMLTHPRLKLFITHGGYNSLMEAARAGVPLICMGYFADQKRNAKVVERNGWGLPFEKRNLLQGYKEFSEVIGEVLNNSTYSQKAKRTQKLVLNKPFTAEERLQRSIRFLELSGGHLPELMSESRNMSIVALYNVDIAFVIALIIFIFMMAIFILVAFTAILASLAVVLCGKAVEKLAWIRMMNRRRKVAEWSE